MYSLYRIDLSNLQIHLCHLLQLVYRHFVPLSLTIGMVRLELTTTRSRSAHSSQLNYIPFVIERGASRRSEITNEGPRRGHPVSTQVCIPFFNFYYNLFWKIYCIQKHFDFFSLIFYVYKCKPCLFNFKLE